MSKYEQSRRFARETIERGVSAAEEASLAGMRELNIKLIDMARANADAVFDLAQEVASAR